MIDIKTTIYKNIVDKINYMRYQAVDNPATFKTIMGLVVLDFMIEWVEGTDEFHHILQALIEKRQNILTHNSCINPVYADTSTAYVNVNTPQTNETWKRVWDAEDEEDYVQISPDCPVDESHGEGIRFGGLKNYN